MNTKEWKVKTDATASALKRIVKCADCGKDIKFPNKPVIQGISSEIGVYYKGPGICWKCAGIRKEEAFIKHEAT